MNRGVGGRRYRYATLQPDLDVARPVHALLRLGRERHD